MEFVLAPFIFIYHIVHAIISFPSKLFSKTGDKLIEAKDKTELLKEKVTTSNLINESVNNQIITGASSSAAINKSMNEKAVNTSNVVDTSNATSVLDNKKVERARTPLKGYKYTIINGVGKKESGTIEAESRQEATNFLNQLGYQILDVELRGKLDIDITIGSHIKTADLAFALTQLSTYLRAGIPLVDSVKILAKQTSKKEIRKHYNQIVYELLKGEDFSRALAAQGNYFPKLLINMVKTAEMTGDLPAILDDMSDYYTSIDNTRKQMRSAMTYPVVVLLLAVGVLIFMLTTLVPQFSAMFEGSGQSLPKLTQTILDISDFVKTNIFFLVFGIASIITGVVVLYKKVKGFRTLLQTFAMHLPVFGNIIIYNEIANFTKTFASLINHGVFITDSMEILGKITTNEVYKRIINKTLTNLGKGDSISSAFKGEWAVPVVAYEMIVTGESTGQLGSMMEKVATHFQNLHKNIVDQMKSLVEPFLIIFLAVIVGIILVSIVQPMFGIYSTIQ